AQTAGLAVDFNSNSIASMGADWADFDRDGLLDLVVTNFQWFSFVLFQNAGDNFFIDSSAPTGLLQATRNRLGFGAKWIDFDNDGRVDLLVVDYEGPVMLLENHSRTNNHWLKLDLRSAAPNVFAYGARVTGKAGEQIWVADVSPASSYLSSSDPRIHWGLGD